MSQGTVSGLLLFLIRMTAISINVTSYIVSFADDTRLYPGINIASDQMSLQADLNKVYG